MKAFGQDNIAWVSLDKEDNHRTRLLTDPMDRTTEEQMQKNAL